MNLGFAGRIGQDAEVKEINGKEYAAFSVAVRTGSDTPPIWVDVLSSQLGLAQYLTKGSSVAVFGKPRFRVYNDEAKISVFANHIDLLGGKSDDTAKDTKPTSAAAKKRSADLPF